MSKPRIPNIHDRQVRINCKNFHIARAHKSEEGILIFDRPEHLVGVEKVTKNPTVAGAKLYGDGIVRIMSNKKTAYQLTIDHNGIDESVKSYMEGTKITESGLEYGTSKDEPGIFACGWEVEKTGGFKQFIWWPYCIVEPIDEETQQTEDNVNFSTDSLKIIAMEHPKIGRYYVKFDTEAHPDTEVTAEQWFSKVQIGDSVETEPEPAGDGG